MVTHLEAIYEEGVLRPLEPLALPERQRVRLTIEHEPERTACEPSVLEDRSAELSWLAKESFPYAGQWVALDGNRLVAHGPKFAAVRETARAAGIAEPFFASVPDDDLPFGGW